MRGWLGYSRLEDKGKGKETKPLAEANGPKAAFKPKDAAPKTQDAIPMQRRLIPNPRKLPKAINPLVFQ